MIKNNSDNEIVQYYIINKDLDMSKGKIAVSAAHVATTIASFHYYNDPIFDIWFRLNQKKIALEGSQKDLEKLVDKGFYHVRDLGYKEVEKGSLTCVGLPPLYRKDAQKFVKRLQLL